MSVIRDSRNVKNLEILNDFSQEFYLRFIFCVFARDDLILLLNLFSMDQFLREKDQSHRKKSSKLALSFENLLYES